MLLFININNKFEKGQSAVTEAAPEAKMNLDECISFEDKRCMCLNFKTKPIIFVVPVLATVQMTCNQFK